jgi:hypothetical protein
MKTYRVAAKTRKPYFYFALSICPVEGVKDILKIATLMPSRDEYVIKNINIYL